MDLEVVVEVMTQMMILVTTQEIQGMITMAGILLEGLQVILIIMGEVHLEEALEVIHLEEVFPSQEETHLQEIISVMDMLPGDTQDFQILVLQEEMGILQGPQGPQGQVWIQE